MALKQLFAKTPANLTRSLSSVSNKQYQGYVLQLSQTQLEMRDLLRKFTQEEVTPNAAHFDRTGEHPSEIFKKAWSLGLCNNHIPEDCGGTEQSLFDTCMVSEEMSYGCSGISTAIGSTNLGQVPVVLFGNKSQQKKYLGRLAEEPLLTGYCVTEASTGSDVAAVQTKAVRKGDEWVLNGEKMWISNGGIANWYYVLARTDPDPKCPASKAFTGFIVERNTPGVTPGKKEVNMGQRASDTRGVAFEDVVIPKENVLGAEGLGFKITMQAFDITRPPISSSAVGLAKRALDESTKYAMERKAFGVPIAHHQGIGFKLAEMASRIDAAQLAWRKTAWEADNGVRNSYSAAVAKLLCATTANWCAREAVQVFGGAGFNTEFPVEKLMRDAKIFQIYEGTDEIQKVIISRHLVERAKCGERWD